MGTWRSLTWRSIFVYLLWISMAPSAHHDWPTFENHTHTYKCHASRNTHTYNDSHLFQPFVDCSCNAGQTHRCVTVQVFTFHITSSSTIHPFQLSPFFFILHFCSPSCPSSTIFLFPLLPEGSVGHTVCPFLSLYVSLPPFFHPLSQSNKLVQSFIFPPYSVDALLGSLSRENC